jgi:hypothetical protein
MRFPGFSARGHLPKSFFSQSCHGLGLLSINRSVQEDQNTLEEVLGTTLDFPRDMRTTCGRLWTRLLQEFLDLGFFPFHQLHRGHGHQITIAIGLEPEPGHNAREALCDHHWVRQLHLLALA